MSQYWDFLASTFQTLGTEKWYLQWFSIAFKKVAKPWFRWICLSHVLERPASFLFPGFLPVPRSLPLPGAVSSSSEEPLSICPQQILLFPTRIELLAVRFLWLLQQFSYKTIFPLFSGYLQQGNTVIKSSWSEIYEMKFNNYFTRDLRKWPTYFGPQLSVCWMRMK